MMQDVHVKLNPELTWQKRIQNKEGSFHQQIRCKFKQETYKMLQLCMVLKVGHFGK